MELNFLTDSSRKEALKIKSVDYESELSSGEAFLLLLKDLDYETIDNLCLEVGKKLSIEPSTIYSIIQKGHKAISDERFIDLVLETAYEIIHSKRSLGNKVNKSGFNASSWISHSLFEGELASDFAEALGLDKDTAKKLGILHDIGRKFDHSFMHIVKGYEYLSSLGYNKEAICCLTHSFLSVSENNISIGNRCANCDPSLEGFYINKKGQGVFKEGSKLDDMTLFLSNYHYNIYDIILNISDLMADGSGIISPYDRVNSIYSRRKFIDSKNSPFFQICFINSMRRIMYLYTGNQKYSQTINITAFSSPEGIGELFKKESDEFLQMYYKILDNKSKQYS